MARPDGAGRVNRVGRAGEAVAWVESPFQLIGALEAHAAGLVAERLVVAPRSGIDALAVTLAELIRLGLPDGVRILAPAAAPPRWVEVLAVGDAFSGQVQRHLAGTPPRKIVLLDDGRATRRLLDALVCHDVPLLRPHVPASAARSVLARVALARLHRHAGHGRLRMVTALDLSEQLLDGARAAGVYVMRHDFGWLRGLPPAENASASGLVVLGTSMVANGLIDVEPYLEWVHSIAGSTVGPGPITYRAHRREDARTLAPLAAAGVDVRTGELPVEVSLRDLKPDQDVVTLPTTAASTLRMLNPHNRIREYAVPDGWWLPGVPDVARRRLVPDLSAGPAAPWQRLGRAPMAVAL